MNAIDTECLDIVEKNLFAIQTLLDIDVRVYRWEPVDNGIIIFISGNLSKSDDTDKICLGIKKFYSYLFNRDLGEEVRMVDCEYILRLGSFELYIY